MASTNPAYPPFYWSPAGFVASNVVSFAAGVAVGAAIWGGCDWLGHNVIINVVRFNAFNHTDIANNVWVHNPAHRGDVPYRNAGVAERFDRADPVAARDALKDRFDAGRPVMSRTWDGIGNAARTVDPERRIPDVARDAERQADRMTPPPRDFGRPMADSLSLELRSRALVEDSAAVSLAAGIVSDTDAVQPCAIPRCRAHQMTDQPIYTNRGIS